MTDANLRMCHNTDRVDSYFACYFNNCKVASLNVQSATWLAIPLSIGLPEAPGISHS